MKTLNELGLLAYLDERYLPQKLYRPFREYVADFKENLPAGAPDALPSPDDEYPVQKLKDLADQYGLRIVYHPSLEDVGLADYIHTDVPSHMYENYRAYVARIQPEIPVPLPAPDEWSAVLRIKNLAERYDVKGVSSGSAVSDARHLTQAKDVYNQIVQVLPRLRATKWDADECELFGIGRDDFEMPRECHRSSDLYEMEARYARIIGAFEQAKSMPATERRFALFEKRLERIEAKLKEMQQ